MLKDKKILLIISGGIAAYKALELIRLLRKDNATVNCILTQGGAQFVTPLSISALSGQKVYTDLWSLTDETEMGHIRLARDHDLILIAPASADVIAKMAHGHANDLATTTLLATTTQIMVAPAMNPSMWEHPATQNNIEILRKRGVLILEPEKGEMACGENGLGRFPHPEFIQEKLKNFFFDRPLKGKKILITSGSTQEPIDPVRFIGNRSSGKQGYAIATELHQRGADVILISGASTLPAPAGVKTIYIQTADQMLHACLNALPCDAAICAAAVGDWALKEPHATKIKKNAATSSLSINLQETKDILKTIAQHPTLRPKLVVGFAAETNNLHKNAAEKFEKKGCDWLLANEVGQDASGQEKTFGQDKNKILFLSRDGTEEWPQISKENVANKLTDLVQDFFA